MAQDQDVVGQMMAAGLDAPPQPLDLTGKRRYFGPKKKQWYRLSELRTSSGAWVVVGAFGDYKHGVREKVAVDWQGMAEADRAELLARREAAAAAERAARAELERLAKMDAADLWAHAARTGRSAYLERKGVEAEACRFLRDGSIVVPLLRYDVPREDALKGLQRIYPGPRVHGRTGDELPQKVFTKGFAKTGCSVRLGLVAAGAPILVCEGYATGLSLRMALERRLPVFVALDAGNLRPVADMLRALYPGSSLLVCADDDYKTAGNPGRDAAHKLCREVVDCCYTFPVFGPQRGAKDTDFNDLHLLEGLHVVARQLRGVLRLLGYEGALHAA